MALRVATVVSLAALLTVPALHRAPAADATLSRGEYLARAGDCIACHTAPGGKPFAGGSYLPTPFGQISVPNITPDPETGIGKWSDDKFYRAMHEGVGGEGEYLYPAFPFPWYTKVTRDDVLAIKAYLFSVPPEHAPRKPMKLAFPASIRAGLLGWRTAFFHDGEFKPDPHASEQVNRGAYLVEGLGHCGECHNSQKLTGVSGWSGTLQGGQIEGWYAPNLTSDPKQGIGSWSEDELANYLKTGSSPHGGPALGPMMETVRDSLSYLSDGDLHAIAAYLKSVPAKQTYTPETRTVAASDTYLTFCASCHRPDGKGIPGQFPALAGNGAVTAKGAQDILHVVLGGLYADKGFGPMPAVGVTMTDQQVADSVNYIRTAWGNAAPGTVGPGEVGEIRKQTRSTLSGNPDGGCPPVTDPPIKAALDANAWPAGMEQMALEDQLLALDSLLSKIKAAAPHADNTKLTNELTDAYCARLAAAHVAQPELGARLGQFAMMAYGQLQTNAQN